MVNFKKIAKEISREDWAQSLRSVKTEEELSFWKDFFFQKGRRETASMIEEIIEACEDLPGAIPAALKENFEAVALEWYKMKSCNNEEIVVTGENKESASALSYEELTSSDPMEEVEKIMRDVIDDISQIRFFHSNVGIEEEIVSNRNGGGLYYFGFETDGSVSNTGEDLYEVYARTSGVPINYIDRGKRVITNYTYIVCYCQRGYPSLGTPEIVRVYLNDPDLQKLEKVVAKLKYFNFLNEEDVNEINMPQFIAAKQDPRIALGWVIKTLNPRLIFSPILQGESIIRGKGFLTWKGQEYEVCLNPRNVFSAIYNRKIKQLTRAVAILQNEHYDILSDEDFFNSPSDEELEKRKKEKKEKDQKARLAAIAEEKGRRRQYAEEVIAKAKQLGFSWEKIRFILDKAGVTGLKGINAMAALPRGKVAKFVKNTNEDNKAWKYCLDVLGGEVVDSLPRYNLMEIREICEIFLIVS